MKTKNRIIGKIYKATAGKPKAGMKVEKALVLYKRSQFPISACAVKNNMDITRPLKEERNVKQ